MEELNWFYGPARYEIYRSPFFISFLVPLSCAGSPGPYGAASTTRRFTLP